MRDARNPLWVYHVAAPGEQAFHDIAVGADGAVVAVGNGANAFDFGGGTLDSAGKSDALLLHLAH